MLDIKHIDTKRHKNITGAGNENILEFAKHLEKANIPLWVRHIIIEGYTDKPEDLIALGEFIGKLKNLKALDVLPYHTMGVGKYKELGLAYPLEGMEALPISKAIESKKYILQGIKNVVASLGTALTEEQGRLLRKYSEQVLMSYDSDGAGQEAIMRGLEILEAQGCDARVIQIEGAKDPDEYIIKYGSERFNLLAKNAISLVEFKVKMIKNKYDLENATDKIRFLKEITKVLSQVENKIEREIYVDKIADQYAISREAIYAEVNKQTYKNQASKDTILSKPLHKEIVVTEEVSDAIAKRENMILYLLINHYDEAIIDITSNIIKEDFKLEVNQKIFEAITEAKEHDKDKILQVLSNIEDSVLQSQISEIMLSDYEITSVQKCIEDIIFTYTKERLNNRKIAIIKELENTSLSREESARLEAELNNIIIELAKIK